MRISDGSSDVCSSDLRAPRLVGEVAHRQFDQRTREIRHAEIFVAIVELGVFRQLLVGFIIGAWQGLDIGGNHIAESRLLKEMRSEEHTSALKSLMRNSYAVFCLKTTTLTTHISS